METGDVARDEVARERREADEDLAALTRVLLDRTAPDGDAAEDPGSDELAEEGDDVEVADATEERRRAQQRRQQLLAELSFLDE